MENIRPRHEFLRTILSFSLIPLSGFATDIYVPSLPAMSQQLHISPANAQLTLITFMISYGIAQIFVGSVLDSFGRYRLGTASLLVFAIASFAVALSGNIGMIQAMRILQGITAALIVVSKRAYFIDTFSGDRLKHYTSLFSIIWATAPIVAPFVGAYLQKFFGWESNFYFLGAYTLVVMIFEMIYGRESLVQKQVFRAGPIMEAYTNVLSTRDYTLALVIVGLNYAMLVIYNMSSPFIIEHRFGLSSIVTGYCSLLSGLSFMVGGILSKMLIERPFVKKLFLVIVTQSIIAVIMVLISTIYTNIFLMIGLTLAIHLLSGFIFNNIFAYCLQRFTKNVGTASGVTGGGLYILTSVFSYGLASFITITDQLYLGIAYLIFGIFTCIGFFIFVRFRKERMELTGVK